MAKYKVKQDFIDKYTQELYKTGREIEMTVKRASEVVEKLGDDFLERVEDKKKKKSDKG